MTVLVLRLSSSCWTVEFSRLVNRGLQSATTRQGMGGKDVTVRRFLTSSCKQTDKVYTGDFDRPLLGRIQDLVKGGGGSDKRTPILPNFYCYLTSPSFCKKKNDQNI